MLNVYGFDHVDRTVDFYPPDMSYNARQLLVGSLDTSGDATSWISGLLDKDSFIESLGGWAKSVIVGRGRLGGIPLGVIVTETMSVETVIPADPANQNSQEDVLHQAGQVWYPDSAYKTAQAIQDMNGESLPLLILANWRYYNISLVLSAINFYYKHDFNSFCQ